MKSQCTRCDVIIEYSTLEERDQLIYAHNSTVHFPGLHSMLQSLANKLGKPFDPMAHAPSRKGGKP